jgi:hypothetical protein
MAGSSVTASSKAATVAWSVRPMVTMTSASKVSPSAPGSTAAW